MKTALAAVAVTLLMATAAGQVIPTTAVTPPKVKKEVKPQYTRAARDARIQGAVWVEVFIQPNGKVRDPKVVRSLDKRFGLDEEAVKAARKWQFIPGTKDGKPVEVLVTIELIFAIK